MRLRAIGFSLLLFLVCCTAIPGPSAAAGSAAAFLTPGQYQVTADAPQTIVDTVTASAGYLVTAEKGTIYIQVFNNGTATPNRPSEETKGPELEEKTSRTVSVSAGQRIVVYWHGKSKEGKIPSTGTFEKVY